MRGRLRPLYVCRDRERCESGQGDVSLKHKTMGHGPPSFKNFDAGGVLTNCVPVGSKVKFLNEKGPYTVQASNMFFSVLTKPYNLKKTVFYTIVDWRNQVRGPENLVFGLGAETREQCEQMLDRITKGESEISSRHWAELDDEWVKFPKIA